MQEISFDDCKRLAAAYLNKGDFAQAQAYAIMGMLTALTSAAPAHHHEHPEHVIVHRIAVAAEKFFTVPSDTAFAEVSAALDEWATFRRNESVVENG